MLILHGTRLYGKVDEVPGLFHVATLFFHVQFIPVLPRRSVLVLGDHFRTGRQRALAIPLSGKSVLMAWLRAVLVLGCVAFPLLVAEALSGHEQVLVPLMFGLPLGCVVTMWLSYRFSRAKPVRALQLATQAGIPPEVVAGYFATKLSDAELDELAQGARAVDEPPSDQSTANDWQA
jgi:hypothetical protein